jgi:hypothetical protein
MSNAEVSRRIDSGDLQYFAYDPLSIVGTRQGEFLLTIFLRPLTRSLVAPVRPRGGNPNPPTPQPLLPLSQAAAGVRCRAKPARCRGRWAFLSPTRGDPGGAAFSVAAVHLGGGRHGLA